MVKKNNDIEDEPDFAPEENENEESYEDQIDGDIDEFVESIVGVGLFKEIFDEVLDIPSDKIFITYDEVEVWGWNKVNF